MLNPSDTKYGSEVVRIPCPPKCATTMECDAHYIPIGTRGTIQNIKKYGPNKEHLMLVHFDWQGVPESKPWWTYTHALEAATPFPDFLYLEGV